MSSVHQLVKAKFYEVLRSIAPLIATVTVLQFTLIHAPLPLFLQFLVGSLMAIVGLVFFFLGIDVGILPMGRFVGAELPRKNSIFFIVAVAFVVGFVTTVAEPDVLVLSKQINSISQGEISGNLVLYLMGIGVGIFVSAAMLRIVLGFPMVYLLTGAYTLMLVLSYFTPKEFIGLAFDAGSVTTGALTAPVVLALAFGLSSVLANRSALSDGFGLLGFASIGPIIIILLMGALYF